jgi:hypothetical protein
MVMTIPTLRINGLLNKKFQVLWGFKKHHMTLVGIIMLSVLVFPAILAEFLSPGISTGRNNNYLASGPMEIHFFNSEWSFHLRPFVYARSTKRDPVTLRKLAIVWVTLE